MDLSREKVIAENRDFFETTLKGLAARHFFTDAAQCAEVEPKLFVAGITSLLCGIEGALRFSLQEENSEAVQLETADLDNGPNLNNCLLRDAHVAGFDIEVLAFPEEKGAMHDRIHQKERVGIVALRNEFAHGRLYRTAQSFGGPIVCDTFLLAPIFFELFELSQGFAKELAAFRELDLNIEIPSNPVGL